MKEDIKILEELIEPFREQNRKGKKLILDIKGIKYEHYEAIQNLIARYKELKEENRKLTARKYMLNAETGELKEIPIDNNYIPKSKVQERIEELKECCKNCNFRGSICKDFKAFNQCTFQLTIKNLQELLEES